MNAKSLIGAGGAAALLGLGMLAGTVVGASHAFAQTPGAGATSPPAQTAPQAPGAQTTPRAERTPGANSGSAITAKLTKAQAEAAALAASPGNTIDHTTLFSQNGTPAYDVDFTNGGGVIINGDTGAVIATEAAGQDQGGHGGRGGHGGPGGADQAALAAQAKVTKQQAEATALGAVAGATVEHSQLAQENGAVYWDVDFTNGGGVKVNAVTGAVIATEAAGTDHPNGGRPGHGPRPGNGTGTGSGTSNGNGSRHRAPATGGTF
jgi:uncharacterized membrane protein YkoI